MKRFDLARVLFWIVSICTLSGLVFGLGLYAGAERTATYRLVTDTVTSVAAALHLTSEELPTLTKSRPDHFLQPRRHAGSGVTVNDRAVDQHDLILLSGFFDGNNELRLIHRDGSLVARWLVPYHTLFPHPEEIFPEHFVPATDWNIDTHGALAMPDGSVVFNFEWGGLAKLDRCGRVEWTVRRQTHHSVERAEGGGFWVGGRRAVVEGNPFPPFEVPFQEDTILHVSDSGQILTEYSVPEIFYRSNLVAVLTANGTPFTHGMTWDQEVVHLNKVDVLSRELAPDFPMFEAGDILLSLRDQNLVMVVDKEARHVKWWKIGPWVRQHDAQFAKGGKIVVFDNNAYLNWAAGDVTVDAITPVSTPRVSKILAVDPASGESSVLYGGRPDQQLLSLIRGKVQVLSDGGLFITEFDGGRAFQTNAQGKIVWQYVNGYDRDDVAEITQARLYPASYFTVRDWSCSTATR